MSCNIDSMSKSEIEKLKLDILNLHYPERVVDAVLQKIKRRIYVLDVLELMQICNEFDALSKNDIFHIRMLVEQRTVTEESKKLNR